MEFSPLNVVDQDAVTNVTLNPYLFSARSELENPLEHLFSRENEERDTAEISSSSIGALIEESLSMEDIDDDEIAEAFNSILAGEQSRYSSPGTDRSSDTISTATASCANLPPLVEELEDESEEELQTPASANPSANKALNGIAIASLGLVVAALGIAAYGILM